MERSAIFIRGQVWYWNDPICGRKENEMDVPIGESTVRYNRYCIIAQSTETITNNQVLVIPCSSKNTDPTDVKINLMHMFSENYSYARCRSVFPADPKQLQRYICTIPDSSMKKIEAELIKLLIPCIAESHVRFTLKELVGIDLDKSNTNEEEQNNSGPSKFIQDKYDPQEFNVVKMFVREWLTAETDSRISAKTIKDQFDLYCMLNDFTINMDDAQFVNMISRAIYNKDYATIQGDLSKIEFTNINLKRISQNKFIDNHETTPTAKPIAVPDKIKPNGRRAYRRWSDEEKVEFMRYYHAHNAIETAKKYGLSTPDVYKKASAWKQYLGDPSVIKVDEDQRKPSIPTTKDVQQSISKVSNMIIDTLEKYKVFNNISEVESTDGEDVTEVYFYNKVCSAIYFSLFDMLDIHQLDDGKCSIPEINEDSDYLNTWHFFDKVYHDLRISTEKDGEDIMVKYRHCYGNSGYNGIHTDVIGRIKNKLEKRFVMNDTDLQYICGMIKGNFCDVT